MRLEARIRVVVLLSCAAFAHVEGQSPAAGTVARDTANPRFDARGLKRAILGGNWRDLWTAPMDVPVLDLGAFAGGLTPVREGGNQSRTLHFNAGDKRRYVFRSVGKRLAPRFNADILGTPVGSIVEDQLSILHPASLSLSHVLETATGVLHPRPYLVQLPDDARLGEFRETFAGLLGYIAERPDDVPEGVAPFDGADDFTGADGLLERMDSSFAWRLDARAWLAARLLDGVMGDFDRGADQWEFACHDDAGVHTCRPIARDRDWAFMRATSPIVRFMRNSAPKIGVFDEPFVPLRSVTAMTREFDRSHLVGLPRSAWDSVVAAMQGQLSDAVIDKAIRAQPATYQTDEHVRLLTRSLRGRRDRLTELAGAYYAMVNTQADVFGTDSRDVVEIERAPDGSVVVQILGDQSPMANGPAGGAVLSRRFVPEETREIRVFLQGGNDEAIVRGSASRSILVRVTGGAGNDRLVDSSRVSSGGVQTRFYDASGSNDIVLAPHARLDTRPYMTTQPVKLDPDDDEPVVVPAVQEERRGRFEDQRPGGSTGPVGFVDNTGRAERWWGARTVVQPIADYKDGAGVILGAAVHDTTYGFRKRPYAAHLAARVYYALGSNGVGLQLDGDWRAASSSRGLRARVRATQFESQRFYGYGNETPLLPSRQARLVRDEIQAGVALHWESALAEVSVGPTLRWVNPLVLPAQPESELVLSPSSFGAVGAMATLQFARVDRAGGAPHRGARFTAQAAAYPRAWDAEGAFSGANAEAVGYVPLGRATVAVRAGGRRAWGEFPVHEAALLGGRQSIRGYEWNRFAGDALLYGNSELRVPLARMRLVTRGTLGVIALADAGRVWVDGASPGGWHTASGGGLSFASMGQAVSVLYARGERGRVYAHWGFPF